MLLNTFDFIEKPVRLVMKNTVIYIGRKNGSQYHIRQFSLGRIYH
jgi:hypothetical protein